MEMKKYFELSENKNTTYQKFVEFSQSIFRWKFIASDAYIRKEL